MTNEESSLEGKLLLSSPSTAPESYFAKTVIYIAKHSPEKGAIGLIVNNPISLTPLNLAINDPQAKFQKKLSLKKIRPYAGGPIELEKGFILHSDDQQDNIIEKNNSICLSSNIELIKKIKLGSGPKKSLFLFGYCGWDPGQLENELKNNHWIISSSSQNIVFDISDKYKWQEAMNHLKIKPAFYSSQFGNC